VRFVTKQYRQGQDLWQTFIDKCFFIDGAHATRKASDLYAAYCEYCREHALSARSGVLFRKEIGKKYAKKRNNAGIFYSSIHLKHGDDLLGEQPCPPAPSPFVPASTPA
jgi:hypothetical protein